MSAVISSLHPRADERSAVYLQSFAVPYEYPVYFTEHLFAIDNPVFRETLTRREPNRRHRFVVFIDANVAASFPALAHEIAGYAGHHGDAMELIALPETVAGGEPVKNDPALVTRLQQRLVDLGVDRHAYVVGIGGGAFLDLVGYVAATTHRGIRHVRVPTTVLAQNDSGVGVKNGVNAFGVKNLLGCFAPPFAVLNDADFLRTLQPRDKIAGIAEAVKVALIRDRIFFEWIEASADALKACEPAAMNRMIRRCAELHMRQIGKGGDPFETGSARPLDYGHWSAHKLEALTVHELRHGEAVAIGLALDTRYSVQIGMLARGAEERVHMLLKRIGFHLWHPALESRDAAGRWLLLRGLEEFREHLGGDLTVTLLRDIGVGEEVHQMDSAEILRALVWLRQRELGR
ncbi:MAG: 3-dehydroquinate synthase [Burkholderiales bacterium]|nr:3-dehydroquinate synthase [Burkholderiales bacterium]MDE1926555.1 3-dehydroquinate synthase [Burkholderiales bacterium]MDE2159170.1 3-dehydroquinate synthase [Burkholderiales bacterium]MDE2501999.1 3-dehydroquinate synthase [Burkholderiales bacterium]